ncbi:MAG: DUF3786 domain-containing protein [Candidatus Omnitrophica bacterium]|nr:DUF3786 domain-containing protein [Candidatus Omnitrophota bacterium]
MEKLYQALELSQAALLKKNPQEIAEKAGALWHKDTQLLSLNYLNRPCYLQLPNFSFVQSDWLSLKEKIVILHYLIDERKAPEKSELLSFKEMETGNIYFPSFHGRVIQPLINAFASFPQELLEKVFSLGGEKSTLGEWAVQLPVFPKVCAFFLLYPADDEFPADLKILFSGNIQKFLDTEDVVVVSEEIAHRLINDQLPIG